MALSADCYQDILSIHLTNYIVASKPIAKKLKRDSEGEFVKERPHPAAELSSPDNVKLFKILKRTLKDSVFSLQRIVPFFSLGQKGRATSIISIIY